MRAPITVVMKPNLDSSVSACFRGSDIANVPFLEVLAGGSARRSERSVAGHKSEEQQRNAPVTASKIGHRQFPCPLASTQ